MSDAVTVQSVVDALNRITGGRLLGPGRVPGQLSAPHPWVVMKTSGIPGKAVWETPGLVYGDPTQPVERLGVVMTMTESTIELAAALDIGALVVHHPVAEACNSGGVPFRDYLSLYRLAVIEVHEAFHGLHPGLCLLHGHQPLHSDTAFAGIPGNVMHVGRALPEVRTAGDIVARVAAYNDEAAEDSLLAAERSIRGSAQLCDTVSANRPAVLAGDADSPVGWVLQIFPHTGFTVDHLRLALERFPQVDTVVASLSRVRPDHPLVAEARRRNLRFVLGSVHALEILHNGLPLGYALQLLLPDTAVFLMRERVTAVPLGQAATPALREYGLAMARRHLLPTAAASGVAGLSPSLSQGVEK